jgi:hypothetical protein
MGLLLVVHRQDGIIVGCSSSGWDYCWLFIIRMGLTHPDDEQPTIIPS